MRDALTLVSGLAWTVVYIACIGRGFRQRTYCMPAVPLALNFSWECVYAVHGFTESLSLQNVVNVVWAIADAVIVVTFLRFGRPEQPGSLSRARFGTWAALLFVLGFALQLLVFQRFGSHEGSRIAAFVMNVTMSLAFLAFAAARPDGRGQSVLIGVSKGVGTLAATVVFGVLEGSPFVLGLGIACAVLDTVYVLVLITDRSARTRDASSSTVAAIVPNGSDSANVRWSARARSR